jgi:hypothetical protein
LNSLPNCIAENVSGNGNQSGRADINGCINGKCFKIELKSPDHNNKPTLKQLYYLRKWKKAGAIVGVCYSKEDVIKLLQDEIQMLKEC